MNPTLKPLLERQRAQLRSAAIGRWLTAGVLVIVLPLWLMAVIDSTSALSPPWRWFAFVIFLLSVLWMLLRARKAMRTPGEREIAALMDANSSLKGGYVISTSSEITTPRTGLAEEAALLDRLHAEAERLAADAKPDPRRPSPWLIGGATGVATCLAMLCANRGPLPVMRLLLPWKDLPYTTITLEGPSRKPLAREAFEVHGVVSGRVADQISLQLKDGTTIQVQVSPDRSYRYEFAKGVLSPIVLTSRGGMDGVSTPLAIELRDLPRPAGYEHRIVPPAYTGKPERIETQPSFPVLRASVVTYAARFDRAPAAVRLVFDNDLDPVKLAADPADPLLLRAQLPKLSRTCGYQLEVAEADGVFHALGEPQQIVVLPDKPPEVEIRSHNADKLKSRKETFQVKFEASDDISLADVRVLYRRVGDLKQQEKAIVLPKGAARHDGTWELPLTELDVQPHDLVTIVVQARDGNTMDGPGVGSSEPIVLEIPEDPSDAKKDESAQGGGGGQAEQINPLEIQRQLYRDTLRLSLGRKAPAQAELLSRQEVNAGNLAEMAMAQENLGPKYVGLLDEARKYASQAAIYLRPSPYRRGDSLERSLALQASAIDALLKAARLVEQQEAGGKPPPPGEGGKQFSLLKSNSPPPAPPSEEEQKERLEKALADLKEALKKQEEINKKLAEQQGQEGKPQEGGQQGQAGEGQGGQSPGQAGQNPGQGGGPHGAPSGSSLAQEQNDARAMSDQVRAQLEALGKSENGADPAMAAEQMKLAAQYQKQAAAAIARNNGRAAAPGKASAEAIQRAQLLTESLLGQTPEGATEPQTQAIEYQHLIQEYSRRLSYDP